MVTDGTTIYGRRWMAGYTRDSSWAQCEFCGLSFRIGRHHAYFGRLDYRDRDCPWPAWARVNLVLFRPN